LQCVAVCCSVLQCVAVCCSVLQCVAVCCSVLQCVVATFHGKETNKSESGDEDWITPNAINCRCIHICAFAFTIRKA